MEHVARGPDKSPAAPRASSGAVQPARIRRKLEVGASFDPTELAADRWAQAVIGRLQRSPSDVHFNRADDAASRIRRSATGPSVGPAGGDAPADVERLITSSSGRPLERSIRDKFERASGRDLADVRVHLDSPAAPRIQASAFTLGSDIHFAPGAYRPETGEGRRLLGHELGHVMQQSTPGAVTARRELTGAAAGAGTRIIRRNVTDFTVTDKKRFTPPAQDLIDELADNAARLDDPDDAEDQVREALNDPLVRPVEVPVGLEVTMDNNTPTTHPARNQRSAKIGNIGADEFFIRHGQQEVFEGGHLIGHQFFDDNDTDSGMAGDYLNLVPMSRTMNVGNSGWGDKEGRLRAKTEELRGRPDLELFRLDIDVNHADAYEVTLGDLSQRFGFGILMGEEDATVLLHTWIPASISSRYENLDTGSDYENSDAEENALRNPHMGPITDGADLIEALRDTPLWNRLTPAMVKNLNKL